MIIIIMKKDSLTFFKCFPNRFTIIQNGRDHTWAQDQLATLYNGRKRNCALAKVLSVYKPAQTSLQHKKVWELEQGVILCKFTFILIQLDYKFISWKILIINLSFFFLIGLQTHASKTRKVSVSGMSQRTRKTAKRLRNEINEKMIKII